MPETIAVSGLDGQVDEESILAAARRGDAAWLTISVQLGFCAGALASAVLNLASNRSVLGDKMMTGTCGLSGNAAPLHL